MLRFPLNQKINLITTAGQIVCVIVKAKEDVLFCSDAEFQGISLGNVYIDRKMAVAYSEITKDERNAPPLNREIKKAKIFNFNEYKKINGAS